MGTKFRHEWKHEITYSDRICIRQRLRAIAGPDPHAINGIYEIRSLYFDNLLTLRSLLSPMSSQRPRRQTKQ